MSPEVSLIAIWIQLEYFRLDLQPVSPVDNLGLWLNCRQLLILDPFNTRTLIQQQYVLLIRLTMTCLVMFLQQAASSHCLLSYTQSVREPCQGQIKGFRAASKCLNSPRSGSYNCVFSYKVYFLVHKESEMPQNNHLTFS